MTRLPKGTPAIVVCNLRRLGVPPNVPGSTIRRCSVCSSEVYLSPATAEEVVALSAVPICVFCYARRAATVEDEIQEPTSKQLKEVQAHFAKSTTPKN